MQRTLTPRGPDAAGEYCDSTALLVHRRLIVIDPDGGGQPMYAPDGNTILIYNGELYNTEELRRDLRARGHQFTGHSDTEVLLHAFLEWDTSAFARLNGIFAFAIWQKAERRLVLCRDRLGVKPLFFARTHGGLVFGSTIGTVLCHPAVEPEVDEDGLRTVLLLGPARPAGRGRIPANPVPSARPLGRADPRALYRPGPTGSSRPTSTKTTCLPPSRAPMS